MSQLLAPTSNQCRAQGAGNASAHATSQALDTPAIQTRLHELGVAPVARERRSPEYLAKFVVDEIARWEGPIKANGLQIE